MAIAEHKALRMEPWAAALPETPGKLTRIKCSSRAFPVMASRGHIPSWCI